MTEHERHKNITCNIPFEVWTFPCGERHVRLELDEPPVPGLVRGVCVTFSFTSSQDLIDLLLLGSALRENGCRINELNIPYFPYSRQDRVATLGDAFSLKVAADLINSLDADIVRIVDPHSDVLPALVKNCHVIHQAEVFGQRLIDMREFVLVIPDAGALKKCAYFEQLPHCKASMMAIKRRDPVNGRVVVSNVIHMKGGIAYPVPHVIVDDICDGGGTFIQIGNLLKSFGVQRVVLMVTHGFFTNGLTVFDGLIDEIYTKDGRVK